VKDANTDGVLEFQMPSSYVYLTGKLELNTRVGDEEAIVVQFSDNNGLDWKNVDRITESGEFSIDLQRFAFRRYDYRLRLALLGGDSWIDRLKITHDIQCSQRALPALDTGDNTIAFSAARTRVPSRSKGVPQATARVDRFNRLISVRSTTA
jgi:hypothetical protein